MPIPPAKAPTATDYARAGRLREALTAFNRTSDAITRKHRLTVQRYQLLLMVKTARDGTERASLPELRERLALAPSSLVELVHRAEDAGLVRRELSPTNRRLGYVALTSEGAGRLANVVADLAAARATLSRHLAEVTTDLAAPRTAQSGTRGRRPKAGRRS